MSKACLAVLVVGGVLLQSAPLYAGVYSTAETTYDDVTSMDFRVFQNLLINLKRINNDTFNTPLRQRALVVNSLYQQNPSGRGLTAEECLNISAYLIQLNKYEEAIGLLRPMVRREKMNYLLMANLGTACQLAGQMPSARDYLGMVKTWPKDWDSMNDDQRQYFKKLGWTPEMYQWYRRAEEFHLRLLNLRLKEPPSRTSLAESVDALFVGPDGKPVQFVGPDGTYEAGKIDPKERAKLPPDAQNIVEQLIVWFPNDMRLYWLLGELRNASGDVASAQRIFNENFNNGGRSETLLAHRRVLNNAPERSNTNSTNSVSTDIKPDEGGPSLNPWQMFAVGVGAGFILCLFGYWQLREILRRVQRRTPARQP